MSNIWKRIFISFFKSITTFYFIYKLINKHTKERWNDGLMSLNDDEQLTDHTWEFKNSSTL